MMKSILNLPLKELPMSFIGRGEVRGFIFNQIAASDLGYIYHVSANESCNWYEVFRKKVNVHFATIVYPKAKAFGLSAWTKQSEAEAFDLFFTITGS